MKRLLCIFAHPDDETFGPGGALAVWAKQGIHIEVLSLTCGDAGGDPQVRQHEIQSAARILGVKKTTCMHFLDGQLANNDLPLLEEAIIKHIHDFQPDTLLTFDLNGVSGHIDHVAVASATTQAFRKTHVAKELWYYAVSKDVSANYGDYFIYFPPGRDRDEIDEVVDFSAEWDTLKKAMFAHDSQIHDGSRIVNLMHTLPKENWFTVKTLKDFEQ